MPDGSLPPKKAAAKKSIAKGPSGINGATQERLRRGLMEPDARIDLHGMTQQAAHRTLRTWLVSAHKSGHHNAYHDEGGQLNEGGAPLELGVSEAKGGTNGREKAG